MRHRLQGDENALPHADLLDVTHPHLKPLFVIPDRTGDFHQSVHRLFRLEGDLPLFQLCQDSFDASPAKFKIVYTPRTAPRVSNFDDLGRGPHAYPRLAGTLRLHMSH